MASRVLWRSALCSTTRFDSRVINFICYFYTNTPNQIEGKHLFAFSGFIEACQIQISLFTDSWNAHLAYPKLVSLCHNLSRQHSCSLQSFWDCQLYQSCRGRPTHQASCCLEPLREWWVLLLRMCSCHKSDAGLLNSYLDQIDTVLSAECFNKLHILSFAAVFS